MTHYLWDRVDPGQVEIVQDRLNQAPIKVGDVASALGLKVVTAPLEPKISGLIQPAADAPSGFEIKVNKYEIPERQRFTIAHEIAHFLLHRDQIGRGVIDSVLYRSNLTSRSETEANKLAAEIIMPSTLLSKEITKRGGIKQPFIVDDLAALFRVSAPAMKVRLGLT